MLALRKKLKLLDMRPLGAPEDLVDEDELYQDELKDLAMANEMAAHEAAEARKRSRSGGKRKRSAAGDTYDDDAEPPPVEKVIHPPIPKRNERTAGGHMKAKGVVFAATYDDSYVICKVIGHLQELYTSFPVLFTNEGMTIELLDSTHVLYTRLFVPQSSFVVYRDLTQDSICVELVGKAMKRVERRANKNRSLTFMYDQYGNADEELHFMWYPRLESSRDRQIKRSSFRSQTSEFDSVCPLEDCYQYRVHLPPGEFVKEVAFMATEASAITLVLSGEAFEIGAVSVEGISTDTNVFPADIVHHDAPDLAERIAAATSSVKCVIEPLELRAGVPSATMKQLSSYTLSAAFLKRISRFAAMPECVATSISLGIMADESSTRGYKEVPAKMDFTFRAAKSSAQFTVSAWLATKYVE